MLKYLATLRDIHKGQNYQTHVQKWAKLSFSRKKTPIRTAESWPKTVGLLKIQDDEVRGVKLQNSKGSMIWKCIRSPITTKEQCAVVSTIDESSTRFNIK